MVQIKYTGDVLWERIERAVEKVKDRLRRATQALESACVPYAVVGGNAVQLWVAQIDEAAVRNTRDVDIVLNRPDLPTAISALEDCGFIYHETSDVLMFLDGPGATPRDAVHVVFAGEKVRPAYPEPVPLIDNCQQIEDIRTVSLESLVRMKLTSFRRKDQVHLLDMLSVGLVDETWLDHFSPELRQRLKELIDNPDS